MSIDLWDVRGRIRRASIVAGALSIEVESSLAELELVAHATDTAGREYPLKERLGDPITTSRLLLEGRPADIRICLRAGDETIDEIGASPAAEYYATCSGGIVPGSVDWSEAMGTQIPNGEVPGPHSGCGVGANENLSEQANALWLRIGALYVKEQYPNHRAWHFGSAQADRGTFRELRAHGLIRTFGSGELRWGLTDTGQLRLVKPQQDPSSTLSEGGARITINTKEAHVGDTYTTKIGSSNVGAVTVGTGAMTTGGVNVDIAIQTPTQDEHRRAVSEAQGALVRDQDKLDAIDAQLFDALNQFLRLAREIQVEQQSLAEVQAKMKATLDDVWAEAVVKGMKPQLLPKMLEFAGVLAANPAMAEVAKALLAG